MPEVWRSLGAAVDRSTWCAHILEALENMMLKKLKDKLGLYTTFDWIFLYLAVGVLFKYIIFDGVQAIMYFMSLR